MIKEQLNTLKTNIENTKDKLYTNLSNKGVTTITTASTLDEMADSVNNITVGGSSEGGNSFEPLGYAAPKYIQDGIDYGKTIKDNWDASVTSTFCAFSGDTQLMFFPNVDTSNVTNMKCMFYKCTALQYVPPMDTSNVTDMSTMFSYCSNLKSLDLSSFNTSNVTDMDSMFYGSSALTSLDLSGWDTSNVTNMGNMFRDCGSLTSLDLSSFNTSNVTNMEYMFYICKNLTSLDLSGWDTSNVTNMRYLFYYCSGLTSLDLSGWDTSNVTNMYQIFYECNSLTSLNLTSWDTSNVTDFSNMFDCDNLEKVDGYISFKSYSSSTMNQYYLMGYGKQTKLRKITFKDIGYHSNAKQFNMSLADVWGVNSDTIAGARLSLVHSLHIFSFDRASAGYSACTVTLSANTKAVLTDDEIAAITAKGFTIA